VDSRLALWLLGPPRIELDGLPVELSRRKALALLAFLAVTGERHRRDALVNLLWPEYDASRGRAALRRTLYTLNKALGSEWLDVDRNAVGFHGAAVDLHHAWVDVNQFRHYLATCETHGHPATDVCSECEAPLTEASALVRGDFLSGFGLKDSFNFDDWQLMQTEALRRELARALDRLVHWHTTQRGFEPALGHARRRLVLDPLDEPTHRTLMRLYAWSGRRPAALRHYEECAATLQDQLGVPPQEATTQLYASIQAGHAPPLPEPKGQPESSARAPAGPAPPPFLEEELPVEQPLFVAREQELAQLSLHLAAALAGQGHVVFVTGDAGSGKTALLQEFARHAQETRPDLVGAAGHGNAQTGLGDPYLPFREIMGLLTGDIQAPWAAGAVTRQQARRLWQTLPLAAQALVETGPDLIGTFVPGSALLRRASAHGSQGADWLTRLEQRAERSTAANPPAIGPQQGDLFEQYTRVLQALAQQEPLLLILDDLQWADLGSISLLFHLGRQLAGCRILIVGAYRPEEVALGRSDPATGTARTERHPLEPVVHELRRDFGDITVDLGKADRREFVQALLESEPNRLGMAFREMLYRQTRGHPLFTVELLRGLQEQGALVLDPEGNWVEGPALDWGALPARVEAVIAERINRLSQPLRSALQAASVEGEVFTAEVLARVQGTSEREVVGYLSRDLDRKHRLVRAEGIQRLDGQRLSRYRFPHILFQRYLYNSLDEVERTFLHEAVGNTLEALYESETEARASIAAQLAWHFQEAGIAPKAIGYLHQAGDRAVRLCAYQEAIAHLTRALELTLTLPTTPERDQQELTLQLSLGMGRIRHGTFGREQVGAAFARARQLCEQLGKESELCRVLGELALFHYVRAEHRQACELAEEALNLAQRSGDPLLVALGHWLLGLVFFGLGEYTAAQTHLQQVISFYEPQEHHQAFVSLRGYDGGVSTLSFDACCLWALGYPEQALQRSDEALALARELDHPFSLADGLAFGGCLFNKMRRDAYALRHHAEELMRLSREKALPGWLATGTAYRGEAAVMLGQFQEGMALMREGMGAEQAAGIRMYLTEHLCTLAESLGKAGQPGQGLATLDEALSLVEETEQRQWEAELHRLQADLLLLQGEDAAAQAAAEASYLRALEVARRQHARSWELRAATGLARLWQEQGRTAEAREMLAGIYGWFTEGFDTPDLLEARGLLEELSTP
jgi:predicted ATPase/DNA-binding SARP family transcriptional activator